MHTVKVVPADRMGYGFVPEEFTEAGSDPYAIRNSQFMHADRQWRRLRDDELGILAANGNRAESWDDVRVSEPFDPSRIRNSVFYGFVRIGAISNLVLQHHDLRLPVGITDSRIIACDIGDLPAIHNVHYLAHYIIGDTCILANVDEMHTTDHAKFGNGILKDGEPEEVRVTIDLVNESGTRSVCPFDGMLPADAYLWARYRDDAALQSALVGLTQDRFDARRGYYGAIGDQTVIKNCGIIKDVRIGEHCYVKGANKLKNLTIKSSEAEPTQIGEGVELVNGIVGYGSHIFYGSKAVRFVLGNNCALKYGARLIHSYLGDNSTVSCCELLNNLIFPAHEQHHNNSFLVAALVMGQSNIAAGATIGSNHNSRANDNEIQAGRGFWPGLNTSLKHSSRFASFVLISKSSYPAELDIRLPFSLVNNNVAADRLEVMPAFWWLHNMYALARNSWKFRARDTREHKEQNIEFDSLAPDTVEEIILARWILETWTGNSSGRVPANEAESLGRRLLTGHPADMRDLAVHGMDMERSNRPELILKPREGYEAYGQMLHHYAAVNLISHMERNPDQSYDSLCKEFQGPRCSEWVNLGGQLVPGPDVDALRSDIGSRRLESWDQVHRRYDDLWKAYEKEKTKHAFAVYSLLHSSDVPDRSCWTAFLEGAVAIQEIVRDRVVESRAKDYANRFRLSTYRSEDEMHAAVGTIDDNSFVRQVREQTTRYADRVRDLLDRE